MDPEDLHARLREIENRSGDALWKALCAYLDEEIAARRNIVEDLSTPPEYVARSRVELSLFKSLRDGSSLDCHCATLATRLTIAEQEAIEGKKSAKGDKEEADES